jgi:hypothetical protein
MIFVIGIIIFLTFTVLLNFLDSSTPQHVRLDYDSEEYALIQTNYPHLKVLVRHESSRYEGKMVLTLGMVHGELISWVEGNVRSSMKVLYIPNQDTDVNMIGMALGYYLTNEGEGYLHMLVNRADYIAMTEENLKLMKK